MRRILHVDMDAFYASVEQRDRAELQGKPVIVGGRAESRGVVAAASYEARRFGIRSAMPTARAQRLCTDVIRVDPRFDRYREVSRQIHEVFAGYTALIEPISLDESFLDVTDRCEAAGCRAGTLALQIKQRIRQETGLTASAGVGPNKLVAKIASDLRKPDGFVVVPPEKVEAFMRPLPVERLWGVGPVSSRRLHALGMDRVGDIADRSPEWLEEQLGRWGRELAEQARGRDDRPVVPWREPKQVSAESTFARDVRTMPEAIQELEALVEEVAGRLQRHHYLGRTVVLKLRYADFTTITRSLTGDLCVASAPSILSAGLQLLQRTEFPPRPIRLIGIGVTGLIAAATPEQLPLW